jgi:arylformamidase
MLYDLSVVLSDSMEVYTGDPPVSIRRVSDISNGGAYNIASLGMGTHSGTHVDLPFHVIENGSDAASAPLDLFCGDAVVMDVSYTSDGYISLSGIDKELLKIGDILIIRTGWENYSNTSAFFINYPSFAVGTGEILSKLGVKALGTDLPSVDFPESNGIIHKDILSRNIVIIESLVNLRPLLGKRCFFSAVPLKITNGDGSPVRAYAII